MRSFLIGSAFVLSCSLLAGMFTGIMFKIAEDPLGCADARAALEEHRVQRALTLGELERLEKMVGRWGSTRY
jgi:hypothetical protein